MNKLFIIGNGFDLAHGLKTSYSDFFLWYLKKIVGNVERTGQHHDSFAMVGHHSERRKSYNFQIDSIEDFQRNNFPMNAKSVFAERLLAQTPNQNWVSIESAFYHDLIRIYKVYEQEMSLERANISVKNLNKSFDVLKKELCEYLSSIQSDKIPPNYHISEHFRSELQVANDPINYISVQTPKFYLLNFNYTATLHNYTPLFKNYSNVTLNYIHGNLDSSANNPIIFGYGDEMDHYYQQIERLGSNEFLKHFKSFGYFSTGSYKHLQNFLADDGFSVHIMGHSCGLSDRILLNSIFEHPHCSSIQIYYYQQNKNTNDYFEKTQEISRHFGPSSKASMRLKIVPFPDCRPLVPYST